MKRSLDLRLRSVVFTLVAVVVLGVVVNQFTGIGVDPGDTDQARQQIIAVQQQRSGSEQGRNREVELHFQQAVVMLHTRQFEYAIAALEKTLELAPRMPEAQVNMGYALLGLNRPDLAKEYFTRAIDSRPGQANAYWGLAVSLEQERDYDAAIGAMRTFIHLTAPASPYLVKAQAAVWEWDELRQRRTTAE